MKPLYDRDGITLYAADALEVLPQLEAGSIDLVLTDPPYSAVTHAGARTLTRGDGTGPQALVSFDSFTDGDLLAAFGLISPLLRRWLIATVDWRVMCHLEAQPPTGLRFVRFGVWVKPNSAPQFTGDRPATGWEAVAMLHRAGGKMEWNGGGHHAVWHCNIEQGSHPTQKPISLVRRWIQLFSDPGDLVLDPFAGSGTTLRAAKDLGRRAIGIEINPAYAAIAVERLRQEVMALA